LRTAGLPSSFWVLIVIKEIRLRRIIIMQHGLTLSYIPHFAASLIPKFCVHH
jgi:hypothetical protein